MPLLLRRVYVCVLLHLCVCVCVPFSAARRTADVAILGSWVSSWE